MTNLFISLYSEKDKKRADELHLCLMNNLKSGCFNAVWVIAEDDGEGLKYLRDVSPYTINVLPCTVRPTFRTFFEAINNVTQNDDINIVCNSDIYFESIPVLPRFNQCFALSRYETKVNGPTIFEGRRDSQDVWIVRGRVKIPTYTDFFMGIGGCDNRLAWEMAQAGYEVLNPSLTIKSYHVHEGAKSYDGSMKVNRPYLLLTPIELNQ